MLTLNELNVENQRILIREDLNVPMENGKITNDGRIHAALPTIQMALDKNAAVIILSHLGRPEEGKWDSQYSLQGVAKRLAELLKQPVRFEKDWIAGISIKPKEVVLCENVRFLPGETSNNEVLAKKMAGLADVFIMDAFATAHRAHASTVGVALHAKIVAAGPLLTAELEAIERALENPQRPMLAIVGGSKVSSKIKVLDSLLEKVDQLILGGGIANTFIATEYPVGVSLYENDALDIARRLKAKALKFKAGIPLPTDVVVSETCTSSATAIIKRVDQVAPHEMILDIGPQTIDTYVEFISNSKTILWNGPLGVFEHEPFAKGTECISQAIAESGAFSIAGGGDTLSAIDKFNVHPGISYISTGGGAFLAMLAGEVLPGVAVLERTHNV